MTTVYVNYTSVLKVGMDVEELRLLIQVRLPVNNLYTNLFNRILYYLKRNKVKFSPA